MATPIVGSFDSWLTDKLISVSSDIDTDVFVSYIIGVLDTEDDSEDKSESITGLLEAVMEPAVATEVSKAILDEWAVVSEKNKEAQATNDIGEKLSEMMEKHTVATVKEKQLTDEEKMRKDAILKQYAVVSDGEETDDDEEFGDSASDRQESGDGFMSKNVNKLMVEKTMKDSREKSKQESDKKKEKDKQDRQAQKQKAEDRKKDEKKRTQKGERRR